MNFIQFCEAHGLVMGGLVEGRWARVRTEDKPGKRNGAYRYLGDHGYCQNHATMTEVAVWHADANTPARPINDSLLRARRDAERTYRQQAMRSARAFWDAARPLNRIHPYIDRKGLEPLGCGGLRTHDGLLVVPVRIGDTLVSVQTITADGLTKRYWPGAPMKGGAFVLDRARAAVTCFVEGVSTGLAVLQSVRNTRVVVCFDSGNIFSVVQRMKPTGSVVICADHDRETFRKRGFNPGLDAAKNAAELIGAGVAWPQDIEGSDFADMLHEFGPRGAKRIEREILSKAKYVMGAAA